MLITAIHHAGLASLTHTPSPMGFLNAILHRPVNEKPFLLLVVGYPAAARARYQQEAAHRDRDVRLGRRWRRWRRSEFLQPDRTR
jgi:hypothetical protein